MGKDRNDDSGDLPMGRIEYDELGNPVWRPYTAVRSDQTLKRILETDKLSLVDGGQKQTSRAADGYNPYGSGLVQRDGERRKKKDLRALSKWVKMKKRMEPDE
ncbi:MAG: hypothetical protein H6R27_1619 [Proteobacteria bacterium]|nr:hypothetical protein [Pseudomonadota bacterium]